MCAARCYPPDSCCVARDRMLWSVPSAEVDDYESKPGIDSRQWDADDRTACAGAPFLRGRIRRGQASHAEGHPHEDGMGEPPRLAPYRRARPRRHGRELVDRGWRSKRVAEAW